MPIVLRLFSCCSFNFGSFPKPSSVARYAGGLPTASSEIEGGVSCPINEITSTCQLTNIIAGQNGNISHLSSFLQKQANYLGLFYLLAEDL